MNLCENSAVSKSSIKRCVWWWVGTFLIWSISIFFPLVFIYAGLSDYKPLQTPLDFIDLREFLSFYALIDYLMLALAVRNTYPAIRTSFGRGKLIPVGFLGGYYLFLSYLFIIITTRGYLVEIKALYLVDFPSLNWHHTWISNVFYQVPALAGITFGIISFVTGTVTVGVFRMNSKVQTSDDSTKDDGIEILRTLISSVVLLSLVVAFVSITSKEEVIRYAAKHIIAIGSILVGLVAVSMGSYLRRRPTQDPLIVMLSGLFMFCIGAIIGLMGCHIHNYLFTVFFSMITIYTVGIYCYNPPNWLLRRLSSEKKQRLPPIYIS